MIKEFMKENKSILHLICGIPGTGKTTLAKQIATETGAIRLCSDEWIKDIWLEQAETEGNTFRDAIEQLQWKIGKDILRSGASIIVEWGTWEQYEREKLRDEAHSLGAKVKFYYLSGQKEVLRQRILSRNLDPENQFFIAEDSVDDLLELAFNTFQIPTAEELKTYDFLGEISNS